MANYDFNKDIIEGEEGEQIVRRDLESMGCTFINYNKDNKYDIEMENPKGEKKKYEVKTDVFCKPHLDTANLFVEFKCRGKASGIDVTEADYFVTYYKHLREIWYIETEKLLEIVSLDELPITEFSGDAGSNTRGYLLPRYQYKTHFKVRLVPKEWQN